MPLEDGSPEFQPVGKARFLIVVARDQPEVLQALTRRFAGNEEVRVFQDRRQGVWRPGGLKDEIERRRPPSIETDVNYRQYVIVRAQNL